MSEINQTNKKKKSYERFIGELLEIAHDLESAQEVRDRLENELDLQIKKVSLLRDKQRRKEKEIRELEVGQK